MRLIDADEYTKQIYDLIDAYRDCPVLSSVEVNKRIEPLSDAIFRLKRTPTINSYEWISVEDRLPEDNTDVLVYRGSLISVYTYIGHNEWEDDYGYWSRTDDENITHWMPLPQPPVKEKNQMKEIHAYLNEDGTYRVEGIGYAMDNGVLKEVRFEMPRAKLTVESLVQKEDQVLFSFEVK